MLTRRRNRKAIMVILIIIAVIFLFKTKVQANESFEYNVNYYMRLNRNFDATGQITYTSGSDSTGNYAIYCYIFPVYSGYSYNIKWTNTSKGVNFGFLSDLSGINLSASTTYNIAGLVANSITTGDFTYTANQDGFLIIGSSTLMDYYYPSGITDPSLNMTITTNYDGTSNYTSLHNDLLRIEQLLYTYLYGEPQEATASVNSVNLTVSDASGNGIFRSTNNDDRVFYIPIQKDRINRIKLYIKPQIATSYIMIGYSDSVPSNGLNYSFIQGYNGNSEYTFEYDFTGHNYIAIRCYGASSIVRVDSYYITNIGLEGMNNTAIQQGEQTRETITSTEYNQSDVNIDTNTFDSIDTSNTDGLFTTIFTNFNNAARGGVDSITIPMPHNSGNLVLYSNVVSSHLGSLASLVSAFWYFVFGFYAFKFVNNLLHSIKNGNILDGFKSSSEVITQDML